LITLIVAASLNNAIGKDNKLLWHLPADLKYFKNKTWGMPVIMGRKTYEAVGKPLPGRMNIVISSDKNLKIENVAVVSAIDAAIKQAEETNCKELFITGGAQVYKDTMNIADKIYLTRIHAELEGDTFFPEINEQEWELRETVEIAADEKNIYAMSFQTWLKK
jgi:dihydrofolate reductase